ncbi:MAG: hypothetical protein N2491_13525 [Negativicutes bacterium]|nr:hypothetical protein [Negativicutes bacterium]
MSFVRRIANSNILDGILDIPEPLKNKKVEILIFPLESEKTKSEVSEPVKSVRGLLKQHANPGRIKEEASAWADAVAEKYGTH